MYVLVFGILFPAIQWVTKNKSTYSYTTIVPWIVCLILLFLPPQKKVLEKEEDK